MANNQTQLSVSQLALLATGTQAQISSVFPSDGSVAGNAVNTLYSFVFQQLARTAKWGALNKQVSLTLLQAAQGTPENETGTSLPIPQQPWLYAYLYPSDCLLVRQILCPIIPYAGSGTPQTTINNTVTPWIGQNGAIPFVIGTTLDNLGNPLEVILTSQQQAVANYTADLEQPSAWDSLFTSAFVASLAAYLIPALSLDKALQATQIAIAEKIIATARAQDGNESMITQDHVPDFIRARQGASWRGLPGYNAYGNIGYGPYYDMCWN
jgi:hypothetical protein